MTAADAATIADLVRITGHDRFWVLARQGPAVVARLVAMHEALPTAVYTAEPGALRSWDDPAHRRRLEVAARCPERGALVVGGCGCRDVCRAGKGAIPGEVTQAECIACVTEAETAPS